ncbi:hypothetical protein BDD12DRAFT_803390 [Trichophaea hybrida]|nr:hypothetical protein BDD12DRAFT_803390 [Trichophaea hybrida]
MSAKKRLIIGLDYGTTYTGMELLLLRVAYCDSSVNPDEVKSIQLIHNWPGTGSNATKEKVPSQIAYGNFDDDETELWGDLIPPNVPRQTWLKLRLDEPKPRLCIHQMWGVLSGMDSLEIADNNDSDSEDNPPSYPGKQPVDMISDYLKAVNTHVVTVLTAQYTDAILKTMDFEVVVTVPAVWSDKAKALTLKAVKEAGFGPYEFHVSMVTEPEAAATWALKALKAEAGKNDIKVGDNFVLCDAGGGTVDLISYKVRSVHPHFQVQEAAIGTGAKCGSTFIDKSFKKWLNERLGETDYRKIRKERLMCGSRIMNEFEGLKMSFNGTKPQRSRLSLPQELRIDDDESRKIEEGQILVTANDLREMFDPHVNRTLELIDGQIADIIANGDKVKYVLLVGGFGNSDYLYNKVREYTTGRGIETRRPTFPWSAVVRGAVARGMEAEDNPLVRLRLCRRHYGTPLSKSWDPFKHHPDDFYIHAHKRTRMARGQMSWLLGKGDILSATDPKRASIDCCTTFKRGERRFWRIHLAACDDDSASERFSESSTYIVGSLKADLSSVPESKFQRSRSGGSDFFFIGMTHE